MYKRGLSPAPHRAGRVPNEAPHQPTVRLCVEQTLTRVLSLMRKDAQGETDKWPKKSEKRGGRKGGTSNNKRTRTEEKVPNLEVTQAFSSNLQSVLVEQL